MSFLHQLPFEQAFVLAIPTSARTPARVRKEHLEQLRAPLLILQGERDPTGSTDDVPGYDLKSPLQLQWIPDGDHSFKPRKRSGRTEAMNLVLAVDVAHQFMGDLLA